MVFSFGWKFFGYTSVKGGRVVKLLKSNVSFFFLRNWIGYALPDLRTVFSPKEETDQMVKWLDTLTILFFFFRGKEDFS